MDMYFESAPMVTRSGVASRGADPIRNRDSQEDLSPPRSALLSEAYDRLFACSHLRSYASRIVIELSNDQLVVTGTLPSFYLKQVLQESLRSLGKQIDNLVKVLPR